MYRISYMTGFERKPGRADVSMRTACHAPASQVLSMITKDLVPPAGY